MINKACVELRRERIVARGGRKKKRTKPWSVVRGYVVVRWKRLHDGDRTSHEKMQAIYTIYTWDNRHGASPHCLSVTGNVAWYWYTQKRIRRLCVSPCICGVASAQFCALVILQYRLSMYDCTLSCRGIPSEFSRREYFTFFRGIDWCW